MQREISGAVGLFRRVTLRGVVVLATVCLVTSLDGCKRGPDASTPKKAAAIFAQAAQAGDVETLRKVASGTDAEFELSKGLGQISQAFARYTAAASSKFGTDGNTRGMSIDLATDFESAEEKIDGDTALLIPRSDGVEESEPLHLKKDGSNWKVDLSFLDKDATAKAVSEKMPVAAKVWDQATQDVDAGKFATFSAAKAAVKYRLKLAQMSDAEARVETAHSDIASLQAAIDQYRTDAAEYPQVVDGLLALTQKPAAATNWHGPYLKTTIINDPWGHPYVYIVPGIHNTNAYDLHSMGPDGKDGTADDIVNWDAEAAKKL